MLVWLLRQTRRHAFTLIELTVVLAVIVTLTLILTPAITNFISDARAARARLDCTTIGRAIVQFYSDTGFFPIWSVGQEGGPGRPGHRLDLLVSPGNIPGLADQTPFALVMSPVTWTTGRTGYLADQLIWNAPGYALRSPTVPLGWNGPYLSSAMGPDPWNNRYTVNIGLIDTALGVQDATGSVKRAVWVLSAGPNGVIETPFDRPVISTSHLGGDDIGIRIQ